ncbi:MAG: aminotransferase class I and II [Rhodothermales bacterium]|nr:aminotransferase class I and II [Rhodothermales bacterium]
MLRTLSATRYAVPLREGGSLPAVVEGVVGNGKPELFVTKFLGAGQGAKALIAEIIVGLLAQRLGLRVPEIALVDLPESFGRTERDEEIQDILKASVGLNVGLHYLDGAFNFNPVSCMEFVSPRLAADIVWLDAFTTNIDRTVRNPNMMVFDRKLWLIDHGAALYFHHDWPSMNSDKARGPFEMIRSHVLLPYATEMEEADERLAKQLTDDVILEILNAIPDELLMHAPHGTEAPFKSAKENRDAYGSFFSDRLSGERLFAAEAVRARQAIDLNSIEQLPYRR